MVKKLLDLTFQTSIQPIIYPSSNFAASQPTIASSYEPLIQPLIRPTIYPAALYVLIVHPFSHPKIVASIHPSTNLSNQSVTHPTDISQSTHLTTQSAKHPFIQQAIISSFDPSNHPYSSNLCTHRSFFQRPKHLIIHSSTKLSIQSAIHPTGISLSIHPSTKSAIHPFIRRIIILSIDASKHPYSSNLCTHRSSIQPPEQLIIHSSTKLSIQSAIHPTGISLSIYLSTKSAIHPFIRRAIISSIVASNHPYSSNQCTHRSSFQPPEHLIIHSSTKLSIQSVIHPSGISLSIHPSTKSAIHPFIRRIIILSIDASKHPYSSNLCTHRSSIQPPEQLIIHSSTKLSIQSAIHPTGISLSIYLSTKSAIHPFIRRAIISSIVASNHPYSSNLCNHLPAFQSPKYPIIHPLTSYLSNQQSIQPASVYPSIFLPSQPYIHSSDESLFHSLMHPNIHTAAINVLIVHPFSHPNILSSIHPQSYLFNQSFIQVASVNPPI